MTTEENLLSTLDTQFAAVSGFNQIREDQRLRTYGKTTFQFFILQDNGAKYNLLGAVVAQNNIHVMLRIKMQRAAASSATERNDFSTVTDTVITFCGGGYTPPAVMPGDPAGINSIRFVSADPVQFRAPRGALARDYYIDADVTYF